MNEGKIKFNVYEVVETLVTTLDEYDSLVIEKLRSDNPDKKYNVKINVAGKDCKFKHEMVEQ